MNSILKKIIKKGFNIFGLDIRRIPQEEKNKHIWLREMKINTILDIGANIGQFAQEIHKILPEATIYSFEPLDNCYALLQAKMRNIRKFEPFMFALGDFNGETFIYKNKFSPSSSILEMGMLHKEAFPYSKNSIKHKIIVKRLDDVVREFNLNIEGDLFIKIDVQGYEMKVISGGKNTFSKAAVIITEVSFVELFKGQDLFDEIFSLLSKLGFMYAGSFNYLVNPKNGKFLQADAIFIKKK